MQWQQLRLFSGKLFLRRITFSMNEVCQGLAGVKEVVKITRFSFRKPVLPFSRRPLDLINTIWHFPQSSKKQFFVIKSLYYSVKRSWVSAIMAPSICFFCCEGLWWRIFGFVHIKNGKLNVKKWSIIRRISGSRQKRKLKKCSSRFCVSTVFRYLTATIVL